MNLTYLSLSSTDCPSSTLTADAFVGPSTEAESGSVIVEFDPPLAVEIFTFVVVVVLDIGAPPPITGAHDVLTVFVFSAGPVKANAR